MPAPSKRIIKIADIVDHLESCRKDAAVGDKWWKDVISFEWSRCRKGTGEGNCQWINLRYTDRQRGTGDFLLRIEKEKHVGNLGPINDADIQEMSKLARPGTVIKKRPGIDGSISIMKYSIPVPTEADKVTVVKDQDGKPMIPGPEYESDTFKYITMLDEIFTTEISELLERGKALHTMAMAGKKAGKTAESIKQQFADEHGRGNPVMVTSDDASSIRRSFPGDHAALLTGLIVATNTKAFTHIQYETSTGTILLNPIARLKVPFNKETLQYTGGSILDGSKSFTTEDGKKRCEVAKIGDEPVNAGNIHHMLRSGATISGFINCSAICLSSVGISLTISTKDIIITPRVEVKANTLDDLFDDEEDGCGIAPLPPLAAAQKPTVTEDDLAAAMGSLAVADTSAAAADTAADDIEDDLDEE
jgi:hypothetical protein